jgi:hypothetical protein
MPDYRRFFVPGGTYFLWTLPPGDSDYSSRIGRMKEAFLDYIHYNPVKHGLAPCPHAWPASSFSRWVERGLYDSRWGCRCHARQPPVPDFKKVEELAGEP